MFASLRFWISGPSFRYVIVGAFAAFIFLFPIYIPLQTSISFPFADFFFQVLSFFFGLSFAPLKSLFVFLFFIRFFSLSPFCILYLGAKQEIMTMKFKWRKQIPKEPKRHSFCLYFYLYSLLSFVWLLFPPGAHYSCFLSFVISFPLSKV